MMLHERCAAIMACKLDMSSKAVLFVLASYCDTTDPTRPVWPAVETIAAQAGGSVPAVGRILRRLTEIGVLRTVSAAAQGRTARRAIDWAALAGACSDRRLQPIKVASERRSRSSVTEDLDRQSLTTQTVSDWRGSFHVSAQASTQGPEQGSSDAIPAHPTPCPPKAPHERSHPTPQPTDPRSSAHAPPRPPDDPPGATGPSRPAPVLADRAGSEVGGVSLRPAPCPEPARVRGESAGAGGARDADGGGDLRGDRRGEEPAPGGAGGVRGAPAVGDADGPGDAADAGQRGVARSGVLDVRASGGGGQAAAPRPEPQAPPVDVGSPPAAGRNVDPEPVEAVDAPPAVPDRRPSSPGDPLLPDVSGVRGTGAGPQAPVVGRSRARSTAARSPAAVDHLADGSAWSRAAALWQTIAGRPVALEPTAGLGLRLARAVEADAGRVVYRLERVADARLDRREAGDAGRDALRKLDELRQGLDMLLRGLGTGASNAACAGLDQQQLDDRAGIARNGPSRASGGRGRLTPAQDRWSAWDAGVAEILGQREVIDADPSPRALLEVTHG